MRNSETDDDQDLSIKSHPSTPLRSCSPSTYQLATSPTLDTEYSPQLQDPFTGGDEDLVSKTPDSTAFASLEPPPFHSNPTPPIDDVLIDSYYRGYGHIPYTVFHHQPTPPSDLTPSPTNASNAQHNPTSTTSFQIEHHPSFSAPPPPVYSFYQGYSYGDVLTVFPPPAGSLPSKCSTTQSEHDSNLHIGDEYKACPSFRYQIENNHSCPLSGNVSNPESRDTCIPVEIATQRMSHHADNKSEFSKGETFDFRHRAASQDSRDWEQELPLFQAECQSAELSSLRAPQYEAWRQAVLASLHEMPERSSNTSHLADYLTQQFNTAEHADCHLRIFCERFGHGVAEFLLHGLLVAQIPLLRNLMNTAAKQENGMMLLEIQTKDRFITSSAVESALQVFYGKSIMEFDGSSSDTCASKSSVEVSRDWMENTLALTASGYLLQLEEVISRGFQIASSILNWENIEIALSFALDGGLDPVWDPSQILPFTTEQSTTEQSTSQSDNTTDIVTPSTSQNSAAEFSVSGEPSGQAPLEFHRGTYWPRANDLLLQCLDFILSEFPPLWELDVMARPLADVDRLPVTAGSRSPLAKSRLSLIRFGDHPSEWAIKLSDRNVTLSSILLSLPFVLLKYILDRQDESIRARILEPIIGERERRRRQASKCELVTGSQRQRGANDWTQVVWEEFVELEEGSRLNLRRKWAGFDKLAA